MATTWVGWETVSDALGALVDRVWRPSQMDASPVVVTLGDVPDGYVAVETYAAIPSLSRARYLVPLGSREASVACLWRYRTMRRPRRRATESTVASMFNSGLGGQIFRERLVIAIDRRVSRADYSHWLILSALAQELDRPRLHAGIRVRRVQPNSKPLLELFDDAGDSQGYGKLGWSVATKQLVRTEAEALVALNGKLDKLIAPRLAARGEFFDTDYSVASPLPLGTRPLRVDPVATPEVGLDLAGTAQIYRRPLAESRYTELLRRELKSTAAAAPDASRILTEWLNRLELNTADLQFGRWHGDWTPHNLGTLGPRVVAWDWEHSRTDVPIGFDALHWHYQRVLRRSGLAAAVAEVAATSPRLGGFGITPEARELTGSLYLLEMFVRSVTLAVGGGGWNPRIYPEMLDVAAGRDRDALG